MGLEMMKAGSRGPPEMRYRGGCLMSDALTADLSSGHWCSTVHGGRHADPTSVAQVFHLGFLPAISKILGLNVPIPFGSFFILVMLLAPRSLLFFGDWPHFFACGVCTALHPLSTSHLRRPLTHKKSFVAFLRTTPSLSAARRLHGSESVLERVGW